MKFTLFLYTLLLSNFYIQAADNQSSEAKELPWYKVHLMCAIAVAGVTAEALLFKYGTIEMKKSEALAKSVFLKSLTEKNKKTILDDARKHRNNALWSLAAITSVSTACCIITSYVTEDH